MHIRNISRLRQVSVARIHLGSPFLVWILFGYAPLEIIYQVRRHQIQNELILFLHYRRLFRSILARTE